MTEIYRGRYVTENDMGRCPKRGYVIVICHRAGVRLRTVDNAFITSCRRYLGYAVSKPIRGVSKCPVKVLRVTKFLFTEK